MSKFLKVTLVLLAIGTVSYAGYVYWKKRNPSDEDVNIDPSTFQQSQGTINRESKAGQAIKDSKMQTLQGGLPSRIADMRNNIHNGRIV